MSAKAFRIGTEPLIDEELATKFYVDNAGGASPLTTKGDVFGFSNVDDRIPIGTNDQILTADSTTGLGLAWKTPSGGGLTFAKVVKSADQTITEDTVFSDDTELKFIPTINKVYHYYLMILHTSNSSSDFKLLFTVPTSCTMNGNSADWQMGTAGTMADVTASRTINSSGSLAGTAMYGRIVMSGTSGEITLQWAQALSNVENTTVFKGSMLIVWEQ